MGNMSIFIGNLSLEMTEAELRRIFIPFGHVSSVRIMNDNYIGSGQLRGYGFVEMPSKNEGEAAILSLNGTPHRGRDISVIEAMPTNREEEPTPCKPRSARSRQRSG
jgi:RNA recognition motif-containing protein